MLQRLYEIAEKAYFGTISMSILAGSVMGGVMAKFALEKNSILLMAIGLAFTMMNLVLSIAQAPAKWVVRGFLISFAVNALIVIITTM